MDDGKGCGGRGSQQGVEAASITVENEKIRPVDGVRLEGSNVGRTEQVIWEGGSENNGWCSFDPHN
jgi:hypothetical protein